MTALAWALAVLGTVQHKVTLGGAIGPETQVMHECIAEIAQVTGGGRHVAGRYNQVRVTVVYIDWNTG